MSKKIYVIAAEASADLHTSRIISQLKQLHSDWQFYGWGGQKMKDAGVNILTRYEDVSFMGFYEVIKNIKTIFSLFKKTKKELLELKPDYVLLVDYPGFNLRLSKWLSEHNFPVYYFISPQLWAWKPGRIETIRKYITKLIVILPFEKIYFQERNLDVLYAGHPLLDTITNFEPDLNFRNKNNLNCQSIIALLPGSRKQEIETMLPFYLEASLHFPKFQIVIAGLKQHRELYEKLTVKYNSVKIIYNQNYNLLHHARFAIVTSGTATLETALFNVPEIVCYKGSSISYHIAKRLIQVKYISLVNLIMDEEIVKELIQNECTVKNITEECKKLNKLELRRKMKLKYQVLHSRLGNGNAVEQISTFLELQWNK